MRVLAVRPCARSDHFAVHYLDASPSRPFPPLSKVSPKRLTAELSTEFVPGRARPVDNFVDRVPLTAFWLGVVVPKRHARRAVTRSLLKRQMRSAVVRAAAVSPAANGLRPGLWVMRLRAPFASQAFPSAASGALRDAARVELDAVLDRAVHRVGRAASPFNAAVPATRS